MSISKLRKAGGAFADSAPPTQESELHIFEVFTQLKRGEPHIHAGSLHAPDDTLALYLAREHYGRDQPCVHVWAVRRDHLLSSDYDKDLHFRLSDQSYRFAKGYQDVRTKWKNFRKEKDVKSYEAEDLKEHY